MKHTSFNIFLPFKYTITVIFSKENLYLIRFSKKEDDIFSLIRMDFSTK
ncbi:hypothetical protein RV07_GL002196 [Enterococcus malodoratus]|nr:hypothetical protein RV07_GL002196 [Enterococcus malodoratus]